MDYASVTQFEVLKWNGHAARPQEDELAEEAPLEMRLRGRAISVTMRTPGHDEELALGFLVSEGIVQQPSDVLQVRYCHRDTAKNTLNVMLAPHVKFDFKRLTRHVFASSSCGLCGKATIEAITEQFPAVQSDEVFDIDTIARFPAAMRAAQATFNRTGGLHAACIFDATGKLLVLREDVGRHNAVDKVIGHCLTHGPFPLANHALLVSGRCSFEIIQKALSAKIPLIAAVSAPSSLAVEFAGDSGQTLVGFLRNQRMNVYTHAERIRLKKVGEAGTVVKEGPCSGV